MRNGLKFLSAMLAALAFLAPLAVPAFAHADPASAIAATQAAASTHPADVIANAQVISLSLVGNVGVKSPTGPMHIYNPPGTTIVTEIIPKNALIIAASQPVVMTAFVDDLKNDLTGGLPDRKHYRRSMQTGNNPNIRIRHDRTSCDVQIHSTQIPSSAATSLTIKGTVPMRLGFGEKKMVVKNQSLKLGKSFVVGDFQLTVQSISLGGDKKSQGLHLISEKRLEQIRSISLSDAQGKLIPAKMTYATPMNAHAVYVTVPGLVTEATLTVTFFQKVADVNVPFDVKVDIKK